MNFHRFHRQESLRRSSLWTARSVLVNLHLRHFVCMCDVADGDEVVPRCFPGRVRMTTTFHGRCPRCLHRFRLELMLVKFRPVVGAMIRTTTPQTHQQLSVKQILLGRVHDVLDVTPRRIINSRMNVDCWVSVRLRAGVTHGLPIALSPLVAARTIPVVVLRVVGSGTSRELFRLCCNFLLEPRVLLLGEESIICTVVARMVESCRAFVDEFLPAPPNLARVGVSLLKDVTDISKRKMGSLDPFSLPSSRRQCPEVH